MNYLGWFFGIFFLGSLRVYIALILFDGFLGLREFFSGR